MFSFLVCMGIAVVAAGKATKGVYRNETARSQGGLTYADYNGNARLTATGEEVKHAIVNERSVLIDKTGKVVYDYTQERRNNRNQILKDQAQNLGHTFYRDSSLPCSNEGTYVRKVDDDSIYFVKNKDFTRNPGNIAMPVIYKADNYIVDPDAESWMVRVPGTMKFTEEKR